MATRKRRMPHLGGKGSYGSIGADVDASMIGVDYPLKTVPDPEDFEYTASMSIRYAGYEPRFTGSMGDGTGTYGFDNRLIREGIIYDRNFTGSMGVRAT